MRLASSRNRSRSARSAAAAPGLPGAGEPAAALLPPPLLRQGVATRRSMASEGAGRMGSSEGGGKFGFGGSGCGDEALWPDKEEARQEELRQDSHSFCGRSVAKLPVDVLAAVVVVSAAPCGVVACIGGSALSLPLSEVDG